MNKNYNSVIFTLIAILLGVLVYQNARPSESSMISPASSSEKPTPTLEYEYRWENISKGKFEGNLSHSGKWEKIRDNWKEIAGDNWYEEAKKEYCGIGIEPGWEYVFKLSEDKDEVYVLERRPKRTPSPITKVGD